MIRGTVEPTAMLSDVHPGVVRRKKLFVLLPRAALSIDFPFAHWSILADYDEERLSR